MKKLLFFLFLPAVSFAQQIDKGTFIERKPGYYQNSILKGISADEQEEKPEVKTEKSFKIDLMLVNDFHHRTKLLQRDLDKINLISIIKTETEHQGYIIDIDNEYILDVYHQPTI